MYGFRRPVCFARRSPRRIAAAIVPSKTPVLVAASLTVRHHLAGILASLGVDLVCVSTLRECHEILAQRRVGLVFCDSDVADGNYQDLLAAYPDPGDRPRVVVTSARADWEDYKEAVRCGAFDIISVPCRHTDVEWMLIQAKRAERQAERPGPIRVEAPELAKAASASAQSGAKSGASRNK
jgi:DNA-binding NtrC family response regulator